MSSTHLDELEQRLASRRYLTGPKLLRQTGGCLPRWYVSMRSTWAISNAISDVLWITTTSGLTCGIFINSRALPIP